MARELAKCAKMRNQTTKDNNKIKELRAVLESEGHNVSQQVLDAKESMTNCVNAMLLQDQQDADDENSANELAEEVKQSSFE